MTKTSGEARVKNADPMTRKSKPSARTDSATVLHKQILFFVGKGGVGKTTAACSAALTLLDQSKGNERIYLFSTDPAHSLADSLASRVGHRPRQIGQNRRARLYACEMDPAVAFDDFKKRYGSVLAEIMERGTLLNKSEVNEFLGLTLPGMDEVMALFQLSDMMQTRSYTHIVIDTAPSGHTMRLLELPAVFSNWLLALDSLDEKHRFMVAQLTGRQHQDRVAAVLAEFSLKIQNVKKMIQDQAHSAFVMVTIPERLARDETIRYFQFLSEQQIPVNDLLINRVELARKQCKYCRARALAQAPIIRDLTRKFAKLRVRQVLLFPGEVRGMPLLRSFGRFAWGGRQFVSVSKTVVREPNRRTARAAARRGSSFDLGNRQVLIFGGKGGVGKTSAASAAAIAVADRCPGERVAVLSTDPAHSLSDSFKEPIGELKKGLAGMMNLDGMEIDSAARFHEFRRRYELWVDEFFASLTAGSRWSVQYDREAMRRLLMLAPPGIDEMFGLATIARLLDDQTYRTIIVDTAPSGHLLRLLELPEVALSWVRSLLKLMLEYKQVIHWGELGQELVALSKSIKHTLSLLRDAARTEFVGVAIPERMGLEETERLYKDLLRLDIPVRRLLVNNVIPPESGRRCEFCSSRRREQVQCLRSYREKFGDLEIFLAPQQPGPIEGPAGLRLHFSNWRRENEK